VLLLARSAPLPDRLLLLVTFTLTVFVDLVVAVNVGVVIAALMFMRRMAESVNVHPQTFDGADAALPKNENVRLPPGVLVYRIDGPLFFGAAEKLGRVLDRAQLGVDTVVIRLGRVPFMDATGLDTLAGLVKQFQKARVRVLLCGLHEAIEPSIESAGIRALVGPDNICRSMEEVASRVAQPA
jgi:sulfate permease, SulP family